MEHEIVNRETPEMKQLISGIKEVSKRFREIAQTHRPLFGGEIYLTGRGGLRTAFRQSSYLAGLSEQGHYPLHPNRGENPLSTLRHQPTTARELCQAENSIARSTIALARSSKALDSLRKAKLLDTKSESFCCI